MARPDPALQLRVPANDREAPSPDDDGRPRLRLVVTKGRLGVELQETVELGPLHVTGLSQVFPRVGFPVDLSQGTVAFRNRRGALESMALALDTAGLTRLVRRACADLLGPGQPQQALVAPLLDGWTVGVGNDGAALCFDVVAAPLGQDLRLLVCEARGIGLSEPAHALALRALLRVCKGLGRASGGVVILERVARQVARVLLPSAGMRVPAVSDWSWSSLRPAMDASAMVGEVEGVPQALSERAVRQLELAELCVEADAALLAGEMAAARRGYLAALAQAPRHPELSCRLADLDRAQGERHEAALVTLGDAASAIDAGVLGAQLLQALGDRQGAAVAWRRAAERESFSWLAALCWLRLGALSQADAESAVDEALGRAPDLAAARWLRIRRQLRGGQLQVARGDVQHLEAAALGHERFEVLCQAGQLFLDERALEDASRCFERALRYRPASVTAVAGLASSLQALGNTRRALDLYARAVQLAERAKQPDYAVTLQLARALVEVADDRPAAIARARQVPTLRVESFQARSLEARWRADLGDLAGAGVALCELMRVVEVALTPLVTGKQEGPFAHVWVERSALGDAGALDREQARAHIGRMLLEGARLHELDRGDHAGARRLLALAMRIWPRSPAVQRAFRRLQKDASEPVAFDGDAERQSRVDSAPPSRTSSVPPSSVPPGNLSSGNLSSDVIGGAPSELALQDDFHAAELLFEASFDEAPSSAPESGPDSAADAQLAELLEVQLRANPTDSELAMQLMDVLERRGRDHELLALLAALLEEAPDASVRPTLIERRRSVLSRMADAAEEADRHEEAAIYREMLEMD